MFLWAIKFEAPSLLFCLFLLLLTFQFALTCFFLCFALSHCIQVEPWTTEAEEEEGDTRKLVEEESMMIGMSPCLCWSPSLIFLSFHCMHIYSPIPFLVAL